MVRDAAPAPSRAWRWFGIAAIAVGLVLLALFGVRAWHQYQYAQRVASGQVQVEALRGWMTLPYIARVYGIPEARLREVLGLPPAGDDERSLRSWFELKGIDPAEGRNRVEALILKEATRPGGAQ